MEKLALIFSIFGKGVPDNYQGQNIMALDDDSSVASNIFNRNDEEDDSDSQGAGVYDPRITKDDLKIHISGTILSMMNVNFNDTYVEGLKQSICRQEETIIDDALEILVEEIFDFVDANKDEGLSYEEWCEWFT